MEISVPLNHVHSFSAHRNSVLKVKTYTYHFALLSNAEWFARTVRLKSASHCYTLEATFTGRFMYSFTETD